MEPLKYKVKSVKIPTSRKNQYIERWFITYNSIPCYDINSWIDAKSYNSINTGKEYANKFTIFLNYLISINKTFDACNKSTLNNFIKFKMYNLNDNVIDLNYNYLSYRTLSNYIVIIKSFYQWYDENNNQNKFKYTSIWDSRHHDLFILINSRSNHSKDYLRWYSNDEKQILFNNFNSLRNKAIFLLTLEGFRIDEVLSMKLSDYDNFNCLIKPSRSKSKKIRTICINSDTISILDRYIMTERADAEIESNKLSDYIFINLKKGSSQGNVYSYNSCIQSFKECAKRAGINPELIKTHSGRSTKVMEMIEHQVLYPDDNITDANIKDHFGWNNLDTIDHYKDFNNTLITKSTAEKIHKRKFNKK